MKNRSAVLRFGLYLIAMLALPHGLYAHEMLPGYLELKQTSPGLYDVLWKLPLQKGNRLPLAPHFPDVCSLQGDIESEIEPTAWVYRGTLRCDPSLDGQTISIDGLEAVGTDVLVRYLPAGADGLQTALLKSHAPSVTFQSNSSEGASGIIFYLWLGVEHILRGIDHLLFVLGLLLIVRERWMLFKTITAFTVAHSLTLLVATFSLANIPSGPVNAVVALSILFLGPEIVRRWRGQTSFAIRFPWVVAFGFGLLHGLAFAGDLAQMGLPRQELMLALLLFNLGVEIGQLGFIAAVLGLWWTARSLRIPLWLERFPGYAIGTAGAYWTIERVSAFVIS